MAVQLDGPAQQAEVVRIRFVGVDRPALADESSKDQGVVADIRTHVDDDISWAHEAFDELYLRRLIVAARGEAEHVPGVEDHQMATHVDGAAAHLRREERIDRAGERQPPETERGTGPAAGSVEGGGVDRQTRDPGRHEKSRLIAATPPRPRRATKAA